MAGKKSALPAYKLHKFSGRAFVRLGGKAIYLGKFGSPESKAEYGRVLAAWASRDDDKPADVTPRVDAHQLIVGDLSLLFWEHAQRHYRKDGRPTMQVYSVKSSLSWLNDLFHDVRVSDFNPLHLQTIQKVLVREKYARSYVNDVINRIRRCFKWGVSQTLVPVAVHQALQTVPGLQAGRTEARETAPVAPVPEVDVNAVLPLMPAQVRDMVRLQLLTGCRPGEIVILRLCDVERIPERETADGKTVGEKWLYRPASHKTQHHGKARVIVLGPKARHILAPWLERPAEAYCFSAAEAKAAWREEVASRRKTKRTPSEERRRSRRTPNPKRQPRERYTTSSYNRAVARACKQFNEAARKASAKEIGVWSVNQLRHTRATYIRKTFGLEEAQVVLGHASADVTQVYAERDLDRACEIMEEVG